MTALQQQHEANIQFQAENAPINKEFQPAMVQEGMEWTEDSLSTSSSSLVSEVTFTDLQNHLEEELASKEDISSPQVLPQHEPHMIGYLAPPYMPSYAISEDIRTNLAKGDASTSQQQVSPSEHNYWNNWNNMENYFQGDLSLPNPKRQRSNEVESLTEPAEARDIIMIEPTINLQEHPHQWFSVKSSSAEMQGKENGAHSNS
ncbi:uncharacterized protein LOC113319331 [Papaver somniferum]|uniref:uncharacterized protein LOC113319331 n=1 Tax=Papaver somniferum TaxID=3469 RepID=UPI000E6FC108|nr:uncharacterized protein LOC113319331 [Papaver somniferum]XP_026423372.1 uncharacterized protein LOC113319331 [Papaver somniferum]XP_026423373.1 uncharacterized protein LOC113319331 [Papaver somniferum]XP_026423374.1 uncharacterized protein LOC113319331 [Papaver somniferum]